MTSSFLFTALLTLIWHRNIPNLENEFIIIMEHFTFLLCCKQKLFLVSMNSDMLFALGMPHFEIAQTSAVRAPMIAGMFHLVLLVSTLALAFMLELPCWNFHQAFSSFFDLLNIVILFLYSIVIPSFNNCFVGKLTYSWMLALELARVLIFTEMESPFHYIVFLLFSIPHLNFNNLSVFLMIVTIRAAFFFAQKTFKSTMFFVTKVLFMFVKLISCTKIITKLALLFAIMVTSTVVGLRIIMPILKTAFSMTIFKGLALLSANMAGF